MKFANPVTRKEICNHDGFNLALVGKLRSGTGVAPVSFNSSQSDAQLETHRQDAVPLLFAMIHFERGGADFRRHRSKPGRQDRLRAHGFHLSAVKRKWRDFASCNSRTGTNWQNIYEKTTVSVKSRTSGQKPE